MCFACFALVLVFGLRCRSPSSLSARVVLFRFRVLSGLKVLESLSVGGVVYYLAYLFHGTQTFVLGHSDLLGEVMVGENFTSCFSATGISKPIVDFTAGAK